MENLPFYISGGFIATTLLTVYFVYRASRYNKAANGPVTVAGRFNADWFLPGEWRCSATLSLLLIPPVL